MQPRRPVSRPDVPPPPRKAAPVPAASVLEFALSAPVPGIDGAPVAVVRFTRPPGIGELRGWLDESSVERLAESLDVLPFRPDWQAHVLSQCAGLPLTSAHRIHIADYQRLGGALLPFFDGSRPTGAAESRTSPSATGGGQET